TPLGRDHVIEYIDKSQLNIPADAVAYVADFLLATTNGVPSSLANAVNTVAKRWGTPGGVTDDPTGSLRQILAQLAGTQTQDADLLLMQLDPQPAQLLELCAIPHLFDHDVVRVLDPRAPVDVVDSFMDEVQSLPSIRQIGDCFAIHDIVRGQLFGR